MQINRLAVFLYFLQVFWEYIVCEEIQASKITKGESPDSYEFKADDLLSKNFSAHKFRDLKRKSRVILEANNRMLHVLEELLIISDNILEGFSENSKGLSFLESFRPISLVS